MSNDVSIVSVNEPSVFIDSKNLYVNRLCDDIANVDEYIMPIALEKGDCQYVSMHDICTMAVSISRLSVEAIPNSLIIQQSQINHFGKRLYALPMQTFRYRS